MKYKAIVSDVDGTLLNSGHMLTDNTTRFLRLLLKRNDVRFILASARLPQAVLPLQRDLGINEPIIAFGGALVLGRADANGDREILHRLIIEMPVLVEICGIVAGEFPSVSFSMYSKDQWFAARLSDPWIMQEKEITKQEPVPLPALMDGLQIHKIMCMGEPDAIARLEQTLSRRFLRLTIYKSKPTYLEITAEGATKAAAVRCLENVLGIHRNEWIAVGDGYNDMDMLRYAGLGVAMGNAPEEVKGHADEITGTNDEDGLIQAIRKYF